MKKKSKLHSNSLIKITFQNKTIAMYQKAPTLLLKTIFAILLFLISSVGNSLSKKDPSGAPKTFISQYENILGTSFEMKVTAAYRQQGAAAEKTALDEIKRLSKILSAYDASSEFSNWMKTKDIPVKISTELFEVLQLMDEWRIKTNGALDPSAEIITRLWKSAALQQTLPSSIELQAAVSKVHQRHWLLDQSAKTAVHLSDAPLMLNSFVKSYIIQHAVDEVLKNKEIKSVVINIGGDIVVAGDTNEPIGIVDPKAAAVNDELLDNIKINNKSIATSGNYRRGELINGQWYSHIVDPRTGMPVNQIISATVIANHATDAGALATAFNVLSAAASIQLAQQIEGAEYLIITKDGERIESNGWRNFEIASVKKKTGSPNTITMGHRIPDFELLINLELSQIQGGARRPFVAIWVEDNNKNSIRTVSIWYNKPRWLHELRAWSKANNNKFSPETGNMASIASATRSAGKYTIKWDGKDDKGEDVKNGMYTIHIEVAREHGTYQLMSQEIKIGELPFKIDLGANVEVAGASLEYKKKD